MTPQLTTLLERAHALLGHLLIGGLLHDDRLAALDAFIDAATAYCGNGAEFPARYAPGWVLSDDPRTRAVQALGAVLLELGPCPGSDEHPEVAIAEVVRVCRLMWGGGATGGTPVRPAP